MTAPRSLQVNPLRPSGVAILFVLLILGISLLLFPWFYPINAVLLLVTGTIGAAYSIQRTRTALTEAETTKAKLETVLSSINDGFYVLDRDWRFTYVNDRYCEMVAMKPSELLGQNVWQLFPAAIETEAYKQFHQAVIEQAPRQFDYLYAPWNCWHDHRIYPSSDGLTVLLADITDRKRAELKDQFLSQLESELYQLSDSDQMLWTTMSRLGDYLKVDRCVWLDIDPKEQLAIVEQDWRNVKIPSVIGVHELSNFVSPEAFLHYQTGHSIVVSNIATNPYTAALASNYQQMGTSAMIATPCVFEGRWIALLTVTATTEREWRSDEVELLQEVVARLWSLIERTRAIQKLRQNEAEFRQLANAMPQIVWIAGSEGVLEFVNDRWTEYTGLNLEQSLDRSQIEQLIPPEDNEKLQADFVQAREARSPYQSEFRIVQPNGDFLYFLTRAFPLLDEQGQVYKWYGTSTDVTALKQLESELRQKNAILNVINESTPTLIYVKDETGRMLAANPAVIAAVGKPTEAILGKTSLEFHDPIEAAQQVMQNDREVMQSGQAQQFEETAEFPDGHHVYLSVKAPYRDEQGNIIGIIGISSDITDRVQLERDREHLLQQEQSAREAAETANRIKDEFLAVLSHELRSPLNPILGWTKLLQHSKLNPDRAKTALETIERNAQLQAQLIDDLLDISRILRGKFSLNEAPVNLETVISAALETVRLAAEAKSLDLDTHFSPESSIVIGDSGRLQQVIWNLLSNAVKFTPSGGKITIDLSKSGTNAQIQVIDTGKGIKPEFLPDVFEHFRQEDGATTRKFGGLGLGLAIARQITELHGGTIAAESSGEGQGAIFTVQLPLASRPPQLPCLKPSASTSGDLSKVKILVVDDEVDSREFVTFVLEQAGAIVKSLSSGIEALQVIERSAPDLIVSDIGMPEMDGYMLLQQLRSSDHQVPAIALTAYAGEFDRQQALKAGFQRHLSKPIDPDKLVNAIVNLLA